MSNIESMALRRVGRPPRDEADELTGHIVACASRLFLKRGYAGTAIEAVAAEARVGKNTIYRRYPTKAALFQAVVDQQMRTHLPPIQAIRREGDWRAVLRQLAIRLVETAIDPDAVALERLVMAEALRFPEIATIYIDRGNARFTDVVHEVLAESRGERSVEEARVAAEQLISSLVYVSHTFALLGQNWFSDGEGAVEAHVDRVLALFFSGWEGA